ncbi:MAG: NAD-dependent epimerase/dehydratase family protein [bacterium]|nr:NAD-dependent epimerase/dehydratase family protein [bacterium]MDI1335146.1 NAD-dependent epimerase/dehydratase family protein [Lacunisphaera sp.]
MNRAIALVHADATAVLAGQADRLAALRGQHVFISGGTGILGTWLLELIKVLNEAHGFEMKATVFSRNARHFAQCWPHLGNLAWIHWQEGDIRYLTELPRDVRYIIHAAALTDRRLFASQPGAVGEINSLGTLRILRAANLLEDVQKFVLMSSGLVYGAQPWELPRIDEKFAGPLRSNDVGAVYPESKRFAEVLAQCAVSETKLPVVTLRPFAFVGPYQSLQLPWAVTDFIRDSFNGGPIRIMGDGVTVRSIMYVSDYAHWVLAALAAGRPGETYNVGSAEPVDLLTLANAITRFFAPVPEVRTRVGQAGHDRNRLVPDTAKAQRDLGVSQTVPLEAALQKSIEWHRCMQG